MPAADSPTASDAPENGFKLVKHDHKKHDHDHHHKHDHKAFERQVEDVSDDLISLRKHLTTALDALFRTDHPEPVKVDDIRVDIVNIRLEQELDRYNASARNYNAAMDKNSAFLIQLKGTNRNSKFFNKPINGPDKAAAIENLSATDAIEILKALSVQHWHDRDPQPDSENLGFTDDQAWDFWDSSRSACVNGAQPDAEREISVARKTRLRRQVRVAYGLSPFHFKPVVINAIDEHDI